MNQYMNQLKNELTQYAKTCHYEEADSVLDLLWYWYLSNNPVDDGQIQQAEDAIAPVFSELSMENSDKLSDHILGLCTAYQRAAFLEGIILGTRLARELAGE